MNKMKHKETEPRYDIPVISCFPGLMPEKVAENTENAGAVILISFATGTTPTNLDPVIAKRTREGIPIFLLSDNKKEDHGIPRSNYGTQKDSAKAGAIALQKVNVNNLSEVMEAIKEELAAGKKGAELGEAIKQRFAYGPDEKLPKTARDRGRERMELLKAAGARENVDVWLDSLGGSPEA